jgi:hypothetical protein
MGRQGASAQTILAAFAFALATAAVESPATAQMATPTPAAALFDDAKDMMAKGNFVDACPKLARSEELDPQIGTMLNLAYCYEAIGKTASACAEWREATTAATGKFQSDRATFAQERAEGVCPHARELRLQVASQQEDGILVAINERPLPREQWGKPLLLDPGEYQVTARAPGYRSWSSHFTIDEQPAPTVVVPPLSPIESQEPPAPAPSRRGGDRPFVALGWITAGVGVASLGVASGFGIAALSSEASSNDGHNCVGNACNAAGAADRRQAIDDANSANVAVAVGAGALVVSAAFWIGAYLVSHGSAPAVRASVTRNGVSLERTW